MKAKLVFDGCGDPTLPEELGSPASNQFQGTPLEKLGEMASRACYDSFGYYPNGKPRGRSSAKLHEHILEVINLSVYEHCVFTTKVYGAWSSDLMISCLNRKGIWVERDDRDGAIVVTANFRAVLEWDKYTRGVNVRDPEVGRLGATLRYHANALAPQIIQSPTERIFDSILKVKDLSEDQAWITMYLTGSRGFSHEQVRHRFAMSQRSTRYVDEDGSPYVEHPLITKFLGDGPFFTGLVSRCLIGFSTWADRMAYRYLVKALEAYNTTNGLDKQTARKQARGASRNYLGNGLETEMLFSAPVSGWKLILGQRASKFADAEIRLIYNDVLPALKSSQYGHFFEGYNLVPSPDGIGRILEAA